MKHKKYWVAAILCFVFLLSVELVQQYWYLEKSAERLDRCIASAVEEKEATEGCFAVKAAADAAYSSATSSHTLTTLALFTFFLTVVGRLDKSEKRIGELESRLNV